MYPIEMDLDFSSINDSSVVNLDPNPYQFGPRRSGSGIYQCYGFGSCKKYRNNAHLNFKKLPKFVRKVLYLFQNVKYLSIIEVSL